MNPNSPSIIRLKEIVDSKQIPRSYKNEILKSIDDFSSRNSTEEICRSWDLFKDVQKGTGILQDIQKEIRHWQELSDFLGLSDVVSNEAPAPKRKQTLSEYFMQLRSAYKNIDGFTYEEKIHLEVSFTYLSLELEQVAYKRDSKVMKLAWERSCEMMDKKGMDYGLYLRDGNEVNLNLIF